MRVVSALSVAIAVSAAALPGAGAQILDQETLGQMRQRAREAEDRERLENFVQDIHEFFEISGELVSFRVRSDLTEAELETIDRRARELDEQSGRLISYVRYVAPYVRGETDGLWVIFDPPDSTSSLEERLTLILALVNRMSPKLEQLISVLVEPPGPTVPIESLQLEASAPYFIVGGLEELREMVRNLRREF